jgi:hypothetical protein
MTQAHLLHLPATLYFNSFFFGSVSNLPVIIKKQLTAWPSVSSAASYSWESYYDSTVSNPKCHLKIKEKLILRSATMVNSLHKYFDGNYLNVYYSFRLYLTFSVATLIYLLYILWGYCLRLALLYIYRYIRHDILEGVYTSGFGWFTIMTDLLF